eukprot:12348639-Karenia_brevis.AAC.1
MLLLGFSNHSDVVIPSGFGGTGAPNDGFHNDFHRMRSVREHALLNWKENIMLRDKLDEIGISCDGEQRKSLSMVDCVRGDVVAAVALSKHQDMYCDDDLYDGNADDNDVDDASYVRMYKIMAMVVEMRMAECSIMMILIYVMKWSVSPQNDNPKVAQDKPETVPD